MVTHISSNHGGAAGPPTKIVRRVARCAQRLNAARHLDEMVAGSPEKKRWRMHWAALRRFAGSHRSIEPSNSSICWLAGGTTCTRELAAEVRISAFAAAACCCCWCRCHCRISFNPSLHALMLPLPSVGVPSTAVIRCSWSISELPPETWAASHGPRQGCSRRPKCPRLGHRTALAAVARALGTSASKRSG